jgi:hypothetical protein
MGLITLEIVQGTIQIHFRTVHLEHEKGNCVLAPMTQIPSISTLEYAQQCWTEVEKGPE